MLDALFPGSVYSFVLFTSLHFGKAHPPVASPKRVHGKVPWWLNRLRIWRCYCRDSGHCCGTGSVPGQGTSLVPWMQRGKKKKKREKRFMRSKIFDILTSGHVFLLPSHLNDIMAQWGFGWNHFLSRLLNHFLSRLCNFVLFFGHAHMWKFPGQGLNQQHSSTPEPH